MALPRLSAKQREWYVLQGYEITTFAGTRFYSFNGELHREDGPAWIEGLEDGSCVYGWYLNDVPMTKDEHKLAVAKLTRNRMSV